MSLLLWATFTSEHPRVRQLCFAESHSDVFVQNWAFFSINRAQDTGITDSGQVKDGHRSMRFASTKGMELLYYRKVGNGCGEEEKVFPSLSVTAHEHCTPQSLSTFSGERLD